ncbi:MAG TPA: hypothetical protein VKZ75_08160, partial [Cyclobacteriaceae bacterium]|nr:hypothetical protein [Cyclobacteriaceae bacterium]
HLFLVYFCLEILGFSDGPKDNKVLGMDGQDAITFLAIYCFIANVVLIAVSYLKLKEREA